jgi:hypothetical protein
MAYQIQFRRGTASQWTTANPTLAQGELGLETDTDKVKVGDGSTAWTSLSYWNAGAGDVSGPGSSTDNAIARFSGTDGETIQNSGITIDDNNEIDMNNNGIEELSIATFNSEYDEGTQTSPQTVDFGGTNSAH